MTNVVEGKARKRGCRYDGDDLRNGRSRSPRPVWNWTGEEDG